MAYVPHNGGALSRARREMLGQLRRANAFSADSAIELELKRGIEVREFNRMLHRGVIRHGARGGFWLDRERLADWKRQQLLVAIGMLMVTLAISICVAIYTPDKHHRPHRVDGSADTVRQSDGE